MEYINPIPLLKEHHLRPQKDLGQNFLVEAGILSRIVDCAEISPDAQVLEIGAGLGSLTFFLAQAAQQVTAVEIDPNLLAIARHTTAACKNITLVEGDILQVDLGSLHLIDNYIVVANIPYYITSAIIRKLLNSPEKPARMVLTIQEEVAQRICASPGDMSLLALSVQVFGAPEIVLKIPAGAFYPSPKVDSVTLRIDLYHQPLIEEEKLDTFFRLIKAGFSQKRKMLHNTLSAGLRLPREQVNVLLTRANIDPQRRAQTLSLQEWGTLTDCYLAQN
ncbi:MAG TPA: ribosomal RNA small subunit methyltransferase A [Anaerolineaceae bacterium]|uniref:Ribosomal RNA small subunit methyltransferase A n=1 Tax=Anaerolinea thermophila TaxID=167964 RepID=A0A101FXY8_9CHLR|nr:MAG: Ribosomal RNA small subunit methyltransferase A [Anaerolinea thermophila]HAF62564.1 ribosomal RNA small subunit methyltransferase A [Anaerolineaceae bacterium]